MLRSAVIIPDGLIDKQIISSVVTLSIHKDKHFSGGFLL